MGLLVVQYLGGDVVGGSAFGLLPLAWVGEFGCQSEIADLDLQLLRQEQVTQFQVPVDYLLLVKVLDGFGQLSHIVLGFDICESFAPL